MPEPIKIFHVSGYRRWGVYWWNWLVWYVCGIDIKDREFGRPGWLSDVLAFYHRGRYGWAPRDVWNLDSYLDKILAETLKELAERNHGAPGGYPFAGKNVPVDDNGTPITDFAQWKADLLRWSQVFADCYNYTNDSDKWTLKNTTTDRRAKVLREMAKWWDGLWD